MTISSSVPKKEIKKRTSTQNRALHKYFGEVAELLNSAGLDMKKVLKPEVDIPWNKDTVKEYLWRPIQEHQLRKKSTTELTTKDIDVIFDTLNRFLAKQHIFVAFPSIEELINKQREDEAKSYPHR